MTTHAMRANPPRQVFAGRARLRRAHRQSGTGREEDRLLEALLARERPTSG